MTLFIPDDILREAGLTEREALIEFSCRLFDAGMLSKSSAARLCGLERTDFEAELYRRGLTVYRTTLEDYEQDRASGDAGSRKAC
jgi:predicted HTH domain antitoxin